ncbi:MAG: DegV family protein [Limnochordaceae bacterium]|nr:DegV family protein [Limnochordaceae bacterium]
MTDSVACVPLAIARAVGLEIVPLWIQVGGEQYRDGLDIEPRAVYRKLREGNAITTSAPSVGDFLQAFERLAREGARQIVAVTLAREFSGVFNNARLAAEESPVPVTVIDSRTAASAQGWIAIEAARAASRGAGVEAIARRIEEVRPRTKVYALVPELGYLRRGGRVVQALARLGAALGVIPILAIEGDGRVEPLAITRSKAAALQRIIEEVRRDGRRGRLHLAVLESDAPEDARWLLDAVRAEVDVAEWHVAPFTPAMGAHAGPGIVGVGYWVE